MQFNHPLIRNLVASGKQLRSYFGNTLSLLYDYRPIKKDLLVCHKHLKDIPCPYYDLEMFRCWG